MAMLNSNRSLRQSWFRAAIFLAAVAIVSVCGPRAAEAQTRRTWNVGSGTWATTGNWLGGSVPTSSEIGTFSSMPFSTTNVAALLNADTSVGGLSFNSFGTTTLRSDSATARLLTLGTSGISMGGTAGAVTLGVSGSAVNLVLNGTQTWTNNSRAFPLTVVGTINTAGSVGSDLTITGSNNTAISGVISGAAGRVISLVKSGAGMLSLSGANTFTGGVTLNSGTLTVNNASALGTGTVTINGGVVQNIASWSTNNPQTWSGDFSVGSTQTTNSGTGAVTMIGNRVITALFSPGSSMSGLNNLSGVISGTGSLTKSGSGAVQINANNTFSGGFTLNSGTVSIGGVTAPFGTGRLTINGGAIDNQNNLLGGWSTIPQTWNGDWIYVSVNPLNTGTAAITLGGSRNVTAVAPGNNILAFNGPIGDGGNGFGFTKSGTGQIDLGAANTYTGATTVNAGTLRLDFSSANAPANNILGTAGTLVMGGGILQVTGRGGASAQTLAGLTLNPAASSISLTSSGGNTLRLSVGEITRNVGSTVNFTNPSNAINNSTNGIATTTGTTSSILGGWATVGGTDWATTSGTVVGAVTALGTYASDTWTSGSNTTVTTSSSPSSGAKTNSLRFNAAGANSVTLAGENTITSGGILVTSAVGANTSTITGGTLRGAAGADLIVIQNNTSGGLTIASTIADNTSATGLTKSGSGNLTLTAANTYTGQTSLNSGTLTLGNDAALGTGAILINNGAALDTTASRTLSGNNSQTWRGNFTYLGTGSANLNVGTGAVTLNAAPVADSLNPAITVTVNSGSLTVGGVIGDSGLRYGITKVGAGSLVLGGSNTFTGITTASAGRLVLANSAALQNSTLLIGGTGTTVAFDQSVSSNAFTVGGLSGTGALTLNTNAIVTNSTGPQGVTLTVGGNNASTYFNAGLISGIGGITKTGSGTLFLRDSANNNTNFLGTITLNDGTLFLEAGNGGNPMSRGWFVINGGTLDSAGPGGGSQTFGQYVNGDFTYAGSVGSMTLTPAATSLFLSGSRTITVAANSLISSGRLFDAAAGTGLTKVGPGLLGLGGANNYFTGPITVSEGVLLLSNTAAAYSSTLSVSSGAAVQFDSAVTGNTFRIGALGGAGDVPLMNTSGSSISLFVGGNNASTSYSGLLSGSGSLIKQGTGVMTLSAANTYSGTTAINGGTLALDFSAAAAPATNILSSTTPLAIAGGTLNLVGAASTTNSQTVTGLTVNSGAGSIRLSGSTANPLSLSVGAITRNVGGTLDLTQPAGTIGAINGMVTTATNSNGILGGWMTVGGSDWAFNDGTNVVALSSYTNDAWGSGVNTTVTASSSLSAATTNSLRFNNAGAAALTLSGSNTITSGGLLVTSTVGANPTTISGGLLVGGSAADLVVIQNNLAGSLTISSTIANNTSATGLTKSGGGRLVLAPVSGTAAALTGNTYTGTTSLNSGTLALGSNLALGTGALVINGGVLEAAVLPAGQTRSLANNNTQTWNSDIVLGGSNSLNLGTGAVTLGGGGSRAVTVDSGLSLTVGGNIGEGIALQGLTKAGAGTLVLGGNNTFTGPTFVSAGSLRLTSDLALQNSVLTVDPGAAVEFARTGNSSTAPPVLIDTYTLGGLSGSANLALQSTSGAPITLRLGNSQVAGFLNTFSGTLSGPGSITKVGSGMQVLAAANTYSGTTTASAGTLVIGNNAAIGTSRLVLAGGGIDVNGARTLVNNNAISLSGSTAFGASNNLDLGTGNVTMTAFSRIITSGNSTSGVLTIGGVISDGGLGFGLFKDGGGTLLLSASNTYSGVTRAYNGTLILGNDAALSSSELRFGYGANGSVPALDVTADRTFANNNSQVWSSPWTFVGTANLNTGTGGVQLATNRRVNAQVRVTTVNLTVTSSTLTIGGGISEAAPGGRLQKSGAGTLVLNGSSNYSGLTTLSAGVLVLGNANAIGTGTLSLSGGSLDAGVPLTLATNNPQTWGGSFGFVGSNSLNLGTGPVSMTSSPTVTVSAGTLTVGGTISGVAQSITKAGNGALVLSRDINTTTGGITVSAGQLTLGGSNSFTGATALSSGTLVLANQFALQNSTITAAAGASLVFDSTVSGNAFTIGALTNSSTIALQNNAGSPAPVYLTVGGNNASTTSAGVFTGSGGITKVGTGSLTLSGANTYSGTTTLTSGTIYINNAAALGTSRLVINGGVLDSGNTTLNNNPQSWNGNFTASGLNGSLNTGTGAVTLGGNITVTTSTLSSSFTVGGAIGDSGSGFGLTKFGNGPLVLRGANTYTGPTTVNSGTLTLDFQGSAQTTNILSSSSSLVLGGGALLFGGNQNNFTYSQTVNGLTLNAGASGISMLNASSNNPILLSVGGITRNVGSTLAITNPNNLSISATNGVGTTATDTNGILGGWAVVGGSDWATTSAVTNRITPLASGSYTNDTWSAGNNTTVTTNSSPSSDATTNSLRFNFGTTLTVTLAGSNTITSGGILVTSTVGARTSTITGGTLRGAAGADLIIHQNNTSGGLTIASTIADNGSATGLTKSGSGNLVLSAANTYSGTTFLNAGTLTLGNATALGTGPLAISAGTLDVNTALTMTNAQSWNGDFTFGPSSGTNTLNLSTGAVTIGNLPLGGVRTVTVNGSNTLTVGGAIGDSGNAFGLTKAGAGTLVLGGANTFTGTTTLSTGTLRLANASALQNSTLAYTGGALVFDSSVAGNAFTLGGLSGAIGLALQNNAGTPAAITLTVGGNNANTTYSGILSAAGNITKTGSGSLTLSGANTHSGTTTLSSGTLVLGGTAALGTSRLVLSGGTLDVDAARTMANNNVQTWAGNFTYAGFNSLNTGTGAVTLTTSPTITVNSNPLNSGSLTVNGVISGAFGLTKAGPGTLVLGGTNTFTGGVTLSAGSLSMTNAKALGTGTLTFASGGVLVTNGVYASPITNNVVIPTGIDGIFEGSTTVGSGTWSGTISGGGRLVRTGRTYDQDSTNRPILVLSSSNSYSGGTVVRNGNVVANADYALGSGTVSIESPSTLGALNVLQANTLNSLRSSGSGNAPLAITMAPESVLFTNVSGSNNFGNNITTTATPGTIFITTVNSSTATYGTLTFNAAQTLVAGNASYQDFKGTTFTQIYGAVSLGGNVEVYNNAGSLGGIVRFGAVSETGGSRSLTAKGSRLLVLSGSGSYTGGTVINAAVTAAADYALGSGPIVIGQDNTDIELEYARSTPSFGSLTASTANALRSGSGTALPITMGPGTTLTLATLSGTTDFGNNIQTTTASGTLSFVASTTAASRSLLGGLTINGSNQVINTTNSVSFSSVTLGADATFSNASSQLNLGPVGETGGSRSLTIGTGAATPATVAFTGSNTYTGTTTIQSGTLIAGDASLRGPVTLAGGILDTRVTANTLNTGTFGGNMSLTANSSVFGVFSGNISSAGNFQLTTAGVSTLSGSNSFSGGVNTSGTLNINSSRALGTGTLTLSTASVIANTSGTSISLTNDIVSPGTGFTWTTGTAQTTGSLWANAGGAQTLTVNSGRLTAGRIDSLNPGTGFIVAGSSTSGVLMLRNAAGSNISGPATVNANAILVAGNWGAIGSGTITKSNVTVNTGGVLGLSVGGSGFTNADIAQLITNLTGTNTAGGFSNSSSLGIDTTDSGTFTMTTAFPATATSGALGFAKLGSGTLTWNASNTYSGTTSILEGMLKLGASDAIPSASPIVLSAAGSIGFSSAVTSATWSSLTGTSSNVISLTNDTSQAVAVTLGANNTSSTFGGQFTGSGSLVKIGTGQLSLTGSNSHAGTTTIAGGTLAIGNVNALAGGGNIQTSGGTNTWLRADVAGGIYPTITTQGIGILTVSGSSSSFNGATLQAGRLDVVPNASSTLALGALSRTAGSGLNLQPGTGTITVSSTTALPNGIIGPWAVTGSTTSLRYVTQTSGTIGGYSAGTAAATAVNLPNTVSANVDLAAATGAVPAIVSANTIRFTNAGAQTLSNTSSSFTVNGLMNAGGGAWTIDSGTITIGSANELVVATNAQNVSISSVIRENAAGQGLTFLSQGGGLILNATAGNQFTGPINVTGGNLRLESPGTYGAINISESRTLVAQFSGLQRLGAIAGVGVTFTKQASGTTVMSSTTSSYSGATDIQNGTVEISSLPNLGLAGGLGNPTAANGTIAIGNSTNTGVLRYVGNSDSTTDRVVNLAGTTGGATLDASGSGALVFTSAFTATGAGNKTFTLTGSSTANNSIASVTNSTGTTSVDKTGSGLWRLTGDSSYAGQLRVLDGTLVVGTTVLSSGNSPFGAEASPAPIIGNSAANATGTASLLVAGGNNINRGFSVAALGGGTANQVVVLGATGTGSAQIGTNSTEFRLNRSAITLQAADTAEAVFAGNWRDGSGNANPTVAYTIGALGNAGVVAFESALSGSATGVNIVNGTARLTVGNDDLINPATPVTIGSSLGAATLDINGQSQTLSNLTFAGNSGSITGGTLRLNPSQAVAVTGTGHTISSLVALDAAATFNTGSAAALTVSNVISESGGAQSLTKTGLGKLTLAGANTYTGPTTIAAGLLAVNGSLASAVTVQSSGTLGGSGVLASSLAGDGLIAPGNSAGILTVQQLEPTGSTAFAFELTGTGAPTWSNASASVNDVLRLTGTSPFTSSLESGNFVNIYFDRTSLANGDTFLGGFYIDNPSTPSLLTDELASATFKYFVKGDNGGSFSYNGANYYTFEDYMTANPLLGLTSVTRSVVNVASADFAGGTITTGQVTQFVIVPEPGAFALAGIGIAAAAYAVRRRRK